MFDLTSAAEKAGAAASAGGTAGFTNADDFEFVEVVNTSPQKVNLAGVQFVQGDIGEGIALTGPVREPGSPLLIVL